jgi:3-hydroxyacyl-[acyl-carrier-protein] dehydratase
VREDLVDLAEVDPRRHLLGPEEIRTWNPQRHEMEQLSAILSIDKERRTIVGMREVREDEWWTRGHVPGRPILPGVLMLEAAAQLGNIYLNYPDTRALWGFGAILGVRFRGMVVPGDTLILAGRLLERRARASKFEFQGFVGRRRVVEGTVLGLLLLDHA